MAHGHGSNSRGLVLLLITSGFFITGLLFDYMPMIIDDYIKRSVELATNDEILSYWSRPPVDVNSYYWLYEVMNPDQFQMEGEKPQLRQVGPFHFVSRIEKRILSVSQNKFRITYNSTRFMRLNESHSADQLDRPMTTMNPIYTSILEGTRANMHDLDNQNRAVAYGMINKLTDRYNESILERNVTPRTVLMGRAMPIVEKLKKAAETLGLEGRLPDTSVAHGKYGYISLMNGSLAGPFEIYTGYQETARSLGELISYKGKRRLNYYDGKCNRLQTSVGELRPMPVEPGRRLEMFQPGFCRIVHLEPTGEHKLREGQAISYVVSPDDFSSAATNPDNRCFCVDSAGPTSGQLANNPLDDNHCSLEGVIDLGPCSYSAPLLMSLSSVQLDTRILNSLSEDFDPDIMNGEVAELNAADNKAQIVILKRMGLPIRADFTLTLIMRVARDPAFKETANVPKVSYIPLVTVRETVTVPPKLAQIIINLESFISLTYHIKVVMYLSAIILLCWLSGHYYSQTASVEPDVGGESQPRGRDGGGGEDQNPGAKRAFASSGRGGSAGGGGGPGGSQPEANASELGPPPRADLDDNSAGERSMRARGQLRNANLASIDLGASVGEKNDKPVGSQQLATVAEVRARRGSSKAIGSGDSFSSERANSADSNRSLPPSRHTSRLGSLSPDDSSELESESAPPAANAGASGVGQPRRLKRNASGTTGPAGGNQPQRARIFSKVDEVREGKAALKGSQTRVAAPIAQQPDEQSTADLQPPNPPADHDTAAAAAQHRASLLARQRRTNWFMNVYSNFVHMLNGLRSTINEASQLEVGDGGGQHTNDYLRDRQLEMLAGKIDNWYTGRDDGPSPVAPSDTDQQRPVAATAAVTNQPEVEQVGSGGGGGGEVIAAAAQASAAGYTLDRTNVTAAELGRGESAADELAASACAQKSDQKATQTRSDDQVAAEPTLAGSKESSQQAVAGAVSGETAGTANSSELKEGEESRAKTGLEGNEPGSVVSGERKEEQEEDHELLSSPARPPTPPLVPVATAATTTTTTGAELNSTERNGLESSSDSSQERVASAATVRELAPWSESSAFPQLTWSAENREPARVDTPRGLTVT